MDNVSDNQDEQVTMLFEDARNKLRRVVANSDQQKKKIVAELAKNLEGKIATDTISMEIVNQLRGQVSEGFVRECLDEKYKQRHRIVNARKQKRQLESKVNGKLARVTTLNQDEEKKELIMVDVDGRTSPQKDEDEKSTTTIDLDNAIDRTFVQSSYLPQPQQEEEQELKKSIENSSQLDAAVKMAGVEGISSTHRYDNEDSILSFEFPIIYKDLQNYLTLSYSNAEDNIKVWFNGRVNLKTGKIISSNLGRLSSSQAASG